MDLNGKHPVHKLKQVVLLGAQPSKHFFFLGVQPSNHFSFLGAKPSKQLNFFRRRLCDSLPFLNSPSEACIWGSGILSLFPVSDERMKLFVVFALGWHVLGNKLDAWNAEYDSHHA